MPIYVYRCPKCSIEEEIILPINDRDETRLHCDTVMNRVISIPQPPIMKPTGNDMALDSLNSKGTSHIKSRYKELAAQGLESPPKTVF